MLEVVHGVMGSGKSLEAIVLAHNLQTMGRPSLLLSYYKDTRFGSKVVASRIGVSWPCQVYNEKTNIPELFALHQDPKNLERQTLIVEEAQFLTPEQAESLHRASVNYRVVCYGLRVAANGKPFPGMSVLLSLADSVREIATYCACSQDKKASMHLFFENGKPVRNPDLIRIGDGEYRSVCSACYYSAIDA